MSMGSNSSARSHAAEAVVQRAKRARSVRSMHEGVMDAGARMVPFTAGRAAGTGPGPPVRPAPARASSLSASVVRVVAPPALTGGHGAGEADELDIGLRYVRALGEDAAASGSFSSLESSQPARSSLGSAGRDVLRVLVRVGERFRFRLPVRPPGAGTRGGLVARTSTVIWSSSGACRGRTTLGRCMWACTLRVVCAWHRR